MDFGMETIPSTGSPVIDQALGVVGALYVLLTIVQYLAPKNSKLAELLAVVTTDFRGVLKAAGRLQLADAIEKTDKKKS